MKDFLKLYLPHSFSSKNQVLSLKLFLFLLVFSFAVWSKPSLIPKISPDGGGYWAIAENLSSTDSDASIRPLFFPILMRLCMIISSNHWQIILSVVHIIFHSLISTLLFSLFKKYGLKNLTSFFCVLIIGFNPNLLVYATYILADLPLAFLTTLSWYFVLKINESKGWDYKYISLAGLFSGLALFTKPVALLMIFSFLLSILLIRGFSKKYLKIALLMIVLNFSFFSFWKVFQVYQNSSHSLTKTSLIYGAINWTAIRSGYIDYGEGTDLHNRLIEKGQIEKAKSLDFEVSFTMDEDPNFVEVFKSVRADLVLANDKEFAKKVLDQIPLKIVFLSLSKWHSYFTKRCFFPQSESFPGMGNFIQILYVKFYSYLYRPFLIIMLLISAFFLIKQGNFNLFYTSYGLLFYSSLVVTLGSGHSGEFIRYRVWTEYIMWFISLLTLGIILEKTLMVLNDGKKNIYKSMFDK